MSNITNDTSQDDAITIVSISLQSCRPQLDYIIMKESQRLWFCQINKI